MTEPTDEAAQGTEAEEAEVVDGVPVPDAPVQDASGSADAPVPATGRLGGGLVLANPLAVQAAAVAVTGFAAGAATVAVVRRRRARKALRRGRKDARKLIGDVRASRSFLVDVHLIDRG